MALGRNVRSGNGVLFKAYLIVTRVHKHIMKDRNVRCQDIVIDSVNTSGICVKEEDVADGCRRRETGLEEVPTIKGFVGPPRVLLYCTFNICLASQQFFAELLLVGNDEKPFRMFG